MNGWIEALLANHILISAILAWAAAQLIKTFLAYRKTRELDLERLFGSGGMPSSHTAFVVAMATSAAIVEGLDSSIFALSFILASVVMYDAAGVRQAAGQQARVLNRLMRQLRTEPMGVERELKELLGHTPLEVLAGAVLGFVIAYNLA